MLIKATAVHLPDHPDLLALSVGVAKERKELARLSNTRIVNPPMLRRSWKIFCEADWSLPNLLRKADGGRMPWRHATALSGWHGIRPTSRLRQQCRMVV
jgi:hypothetical protein